MLENGFLVLVREYDHVGIALFGRVRTWPEHVVGPLGARRAVGLKKGCDYGKEERKGDKEKRYRGFMDEYDNTAVKSIESNDTRG